MEWTLRIEEEARISAGIFHKSVHKIPDSYSENRHKFLKPSPKSNVSSPPMTTSKEIIVDSRASLHMMSESELTPEEQETIRKSPFIQSLS